MDLSALLEIRPGVTAVIGGGGKTTLLRVLGTELAEAGARVLLCTTTKIFPFDGLLNLTSPSEEALAEALKARRLVCAGSPVSGTGKLTAPAIPMKKLAALADYVLVEADGSKGFPLKAHLPHEPVLPEGFDRNLLLVGASGFDRLISQAAHRPERFAELAGCSIHNLATPDAIAAVLNAEGGFDTVIVNQASGPERIAGAGRLKERLNVPLFAGELQRGILAPL